MHFTWCIILVDTCKGARYNRETLEIRFKNKNIAYILTWCRGRLWFLKISINKIKTYNLKHVWLGYMKIGQQATTLSGGSSKN